MHELKNKVVIITGVGRGLGRELALAFAKESCVVIGFARSPENHQEIAALMPEGSFRGHVVDVADFSQVRAAVETTLSEFDRIDIVFNNAAVYPQVDFKVESADEWSHAMAVNVNGVAFVCKAVLPAMLKAGYGRIYNVGSFADIAPIANSAAYSASKGAVRSLTKAIAADISDVDADIEVHEWIPGHLRTRMSGFTGIDPAVAANWGVQLASQPHARTRNCIFENDQEWLPPKGLRERIRERLRALLPNLD